MVKTILYFHGFASSSDSDKAKIIKSYISKISKKIKIFTPDLSNNFKEANKFRVAARRFYAATAAGSSARYLKRHKEVIDFVFDKSKKEPTFD